MLITLPISLYVYHGIYTYKKPQSHVKFMGMHAIAASLFMIILAVAYLL